MKKISREHALRNAVEITILVLLLAGSSSAVALKADDMLSEHIPEAAKQHIVESYGKLPLSFEANHGQTDPQVNFLSQGSGYTLFLTPTEAVLSFKSATLRMQLVGANPQSQAGGGEEMPGRSNYFTGNNQKEWRINVPNYAKVQYKDIYPGVNLVYYGNQRQLEYDFVVAPGADPGAITLGFDGAQKVEVDANGDLMLYIADRLIRLNKPLIYQEFESTRKEIPGSYVLSGMQAGFQIGEYDASKPLVIDPLLSYSTYLGGSGGEEGHGIAVDSSGNAYVTGSTSSINFPIANPFQPAYKGVKYAFISKLNASGSSLDYSTYLGGSGTVECRGIAVDSSGNAYVTGYTNSADFPTFNSFQSANNGINDAFVVKLNASGSSLDYSTYLGGNSADYGNGIAVDSSGNAYITGYTGSANFPTFNPFQPADPAYGNAFVTKLNASGSSLDYSTYLGGSNNEYGYGIAVDSSGNAYVTGITASSNFPTVNPFQPAKNGNPSVYNWDAFVAKLNSSGSSLDYSTYLGGSGMEDASGIAVDSSGNAYVTGYTASSDFPTSHPFQPVNNGNFDTFVAKLNASGSSLDYSTYIGGNSSDFGTGIAVDSSGNAYVTGYTDSADFPTFNSFQLSKNGYGDAFITKLNASGASLDYSTYFGGSGSEEGHGIAVDSSGNAYVTGTTSSTNFPTSNPFQPANNGSSDAFVAKFFTNNPGIAGSNINGYMFNDSNGNGIRDIYESGVSGVGIQLTRMISPGNEYFVGFDYTDTNGNYGFTNLPPGFFRVEEFPSGRAQTFPANGMPHFINLTEGEIKTGVDFGNQIIFPGEIHGIEFNDSNGNGVKDDEEAGISGVNITLYPSLRFTTTDSSGNYSFPDVSPGNYTVYEKLPSKYVATTPSIVRIVVNSDEVRVVNFGNRLLIPPPSDVNVAQQSGERNGVPTVYRPALTVLTISKNLTNISENVVSVHLTMNWSNGASRNASMSEIGNTNVWTVDFSVPFPSGTAQMRFEVDVDPAGNGPEDAIQIGDIIFIDPSGTIKNAYNGSLISGAAVTLLYEYPPGTNNFIISPSENQIPNDNPLITGEDGRYNWLTIPGTYKVRAEKAGFITAESDNVTVPPIVTDLNISLIPILPAVRFINGTVIDSVTKTGIPGVRVITNTTLSTTTNAIGFYSFSVMAGAYNLTAEFEPTYYVNNTITVSTIWSEVVVQNIELMKKPTGNITGSVTKI